jgi:ATP-binding cassette subfamily F protein 3
VALATFTDIEKTFGQRVLFDKLNLQIDAGQRIGLIGDNGSGKTTLLKLLSGQMIADAGEVAISKSARIGYLTQDPNFDPANTVIDEAELAFARLHELSHELRTLEHEMGEVTGDALQRVLDKYQSAQHEFELAGGYDWRHRLEATLRGVGLAPSSWEQNVQVLSGGQRSRLALAKLLVGDCNLLLLDEPTNHLDLDGVQWLEDYLLEFSGAVLIISHDRYLLDRLATRIAWLTGSRIKNYPGNYSAFVEQRATQELSQQRAYDQQQADIAKQSEFVRRFGAGQRAREAKGRLKRLNRLLVSDAMIDAVATDKSIRLALGTEKRAGDQVLTVRGLSKSYGELALWRDISLDVRRGERIGIIGPNGSGKTTLIEVLLGRRTADAGTVRWGASLTIGYYDQRLDDFDPEASVMEEARGDRDVKDQDLRSVLALMLFRGDDVEKHVGQLSGGERARVAMAQLLLDRPNVMVLDEPTNHLDIQSREALENAMKQFPGTTLCVSHDRYFLDQTVGRLLVLRPPGMVDFAGNYTAWAAKLNAKPAAAPASSNRAKGNDARSRPANSRGGESKKSASAAGAAKAAASDRPWSRIFGKLTVSELEGEIARTESALELCQQSMANPQFARDRDKLRKADAEFTTLKKKLDDLEKEYYLRET